jgi:phosphate transport system ATP-binding protein
MDEPTSGLDPIATSKIEVLINNLKEHFTIIIVTHSMAQAQRISDETAFFYQGRLVEMDTTKNIFTRPKEKRTRNYISGKIG